MKNQRANSIFFSVIILIFALIFSHSATSVSAQEVEDESEFDYKKGSGKGPENWGEIKKEWEDCKFGKLQSPIDMSNQRVNIIRISKQLLTNYIPSNSTIMNRGHDIAVQWSGNKAGSVQVNGNEYFLQQCHWHSPSEHTVNGRRYDMELHMVHVSTDPNVKNNITVIGQLYKIGRPDSFLSKLLRDIKSMSDEKQEKSKGMIDPNEIKIDGKKYYRYLGSLTVPPCTEGVIWSISKKIRTVSREQVKALRDAVHDYAEENARPVQAINKREIKLYGGH